MAMLGSIPSVMAIRVSVAKLNGNRLEFVLEGIDPLLAVKTEIEKLEGTPVSEQLLLQVGSAAPLEDACTVGSLVDNAEASPKLDLQLVLQRVILWKQVPLSKNVLFSDEGRTAQTNALTV